MENEHVESISLKALVDKKNRKVIFVESNVDFIDVVFSFLTMPMGTIIRLIRNRPPTVGIGCMNNLYQSVENLDMQQFWTEACKTMLLYPRNGAADQCRRLKLKIDDTEPLMYFRCHSFSCKKERKLLSHYRNAFCECGGQMYSVVHFCESKGKQAGLNAQNRGAFVEGLARFILTDELQVMPSSTEASLSVLSKLGIMDGSVIEECNLNLGADEVLTLLKGSLVSKTPLTNTLLKHGAVPELSKEDFDDQASYIKSKTEEAASDVNGKISVKLMVSKSKKMVCYAEASEDFVDLLVSFLTVPLGYIVKKMHSSLSKGCINNLYNSVYELDSKQHLKSNEGKAILVSPKLAPDFSYENNPLDIEEDIHPPYYYSRDRTQLFSDETLIDSSSVAMTVLDPKSHFNEAKGEGGFVAGPTVFSITDNLIITPISPISCLSLLNELNVLFSDIEEQVVHVGTEEALRLLVASFVSESALTSALLRKPSPEC